MAAVLNKSVRHVVPILRTKESADRFAGVPTEPMLVSVMAQLDLKNELSLTWPVAK
jgi:hypothetical protein